MSAFTRVYEMIEGQMEKLLKEWENKNEVILGREGYYEDFCDEYYYMDYSYKYYDIDEKLLNESYREGLSWIMECKENDDDLIEYITNMNKSNKEYLKQLIFWIGCYQSK